MKRLAAIFLIALLLLILSACDTSNSIGETNDQETESSINTLPELSEDDIVNSVSSLIDHSILYEDEYPRSYNFINETTGYFFQFKFFGSENRLVYLLKTEDGGRTWAKQDIQIPASMGWKEHIACAQMLDENVGFISGVYWADANFSNHTYVTKDGGKTWTKIALPKDAPYVYSEDSSDLVTYLEGEAYDLTHENGIYFLHIKAYTFDPNSDTGYECLRFSSTDLVSWTFIESIKKDDIINSVVASLPELKDRNFYAEDTYTGYYFLNPQKGYFFSFGGVDNTFDVQLDVFLKTDNGGKSWQPITVAKPPVLNWKERILCAKMINDNVGLISGRYYAGEDGVSDRTYITVDGGVNWENIEFPTHSRLLDAEVYDFVRENGEYYLCVRVLTGDSYENQLYEYFEYSSQDLKNWSIVAGGK